MINGYNKNSAEKIVEKMQKAVTVGSLRLQRTHDLRPQGRLTPRPSVAVFVY